MAQDNKFAYVGLHPRQCISTTNVTTGIILRKALKKAWKWSKAQREVATSLDATVSQGTLLQWKNMVSEYKKDPSKLNPFKEPEIGQCSPLPL